MPDEENKTTRYVALLRDFSKHIQHYCASHSDNLSDAEDLLQEVVLCIWRGLDTLQSDNPRQQNRWLQRVMRTALQRHRRQHRNARPANLAPQIGIAAPVEPEAEQVAELPEYLTDDERQLVEEHLQGYTLNEIAQRHGQKADLVRQRYHRIIEKLRKKVNP